MNAVSPLGLSVQEGNGASALAPSVALFAAFVVVGAVVRLCIKETRSVTMNIFRKKNIFKLFVKIELTYVFTINMFSTAKSCIEQ